MPSPIFKAVSDDGRVTVRVHRIEDEYRARVYYGGIPYLPADYFTDDRQDAVGTATAMLATNGEA